MRKIVSLLCMVLFANTSFAQPDPPPIDARMSVLEKEVAQLRAEAYNTKARLNMIEAKLAPASLVQSAAPFASSPLQETYTVAGSVQEAIPYTVQPTIAPYVDVRQYQTGGVVTPRWEPAPAVRTYIPTAYTGGITASGGCENGSCSSPSSSGFFRSGGLFKRLR